MKPRGFLAGSPFDANPNDPTVEDIPNEPVLGVSNRPNIRASGLFKMEAWPILIQNPQKEKPLQPVTGSLRNPR